MRVIKGSHAGPIMHMLYVYHCIKATLKKEFLKPWKFNYY